MVTIKHYWVVKAFWYGYPKEQQTFQGKPEPIYRKHGRDQADKLVGYEGTDPYGRPLEFYGFGNWNSKGFDLIDCGEAAAPKYRIGQRLQLARSKSPKIREIINVSMGATGWRYCTQLAGGDEWSSPDLRWHDEKLLGQPSKFTLLD